MSTRDNSEIRELKADELEKVSGTGGLVLIQRPYLGPAAPVPSDGAFSPYPFPPGHK